MPRNVNADIDSTLFGDSKKNRTKAVNRSDGSAGLNKASQIGDFYSGGGSAGSTARHSGRKTLKLVTPHEVRDLTVRRKKLQPQSCVISFDDYLRLRKNAVPLEQQEDALLATQRRLQNEEQAEASAARRAEFTQIDQEKPQNVMTDLDIEAQERETAVLARAKELLEDDEDEVRLLKSTILQAQCQAVRDAQLKEKEEIARALREEEQRLDDMMEQARLMKIREAEAKEESLREAYVNGRQELETQIEERRMQRLLEEEMREAEAQELVRRIEAMAEEDRQKAQERAVKTKEMQKEIVAANDRALAEHAERERQAKLEDEALAQYMADKVAAQEAEEKRQLEAKAAADLAFRKVLQRQERAMDTMAGREELAARRAQEEKERATRAKEAREAEERRKAAIELNRARRAQIEGQQRQKVLMSLAEKEDFERTIAAQTQLMETQRTVEAKQAQRRIKNRDEILEQVKQKERAIAQDRAKFFAEGVKIDEEAKTRRARLDQIKQRKLDELVSTGLESSYLHSVKRQINKNPVNTFS